MTANKNESYFLGKILDQKQHKSGDTQFLLDAESLKTHAIVTGMTGSGKTGLCITMLEEAALHGTPAIIIDPKGDLTNLLLHFPDLKPDDFEPWLDADQARREGKEPPQLAQETAKKWKEGLASWGLGREELLALDRSAGFTVYTPGSSAGEMVNILASFEAPGIAWNANSELLREKIADSVSALLGLVGLKNIDPLRSREHILLSNIIENAWSSGTSLSLQEIILRIQTPSFDKLGAFPLEKFFPEEERMELALTLNNFLASPSFKTWLEGRTLDVASLLYDEKGKPQHSIFYLAHLSEDERMFFVTLLFAAIEAWMRTQSGSSGLRALVYFDEIMGYLPPTSNPPSRPIILRMLKQARAFGVGLLLATQNPVDVDYKALSNAGTWLIGRLQTEQDKSRLLDGLSSAAGKVDLKVIEDRIAGLGKREFLYHSVYQTEPLTFQTRWALNFLAGPLTRLQVQELHQLSSPSAVEGKTADVEKEAGKKQASQTAAATAAYSKTRPAVPGRFPEHFIMPDVELQKAAKAAGLDPAITLTSEGLLYRPSLYAFAEISYLSSKYQIDYTATRAVLLKDLDGQISDWEAYAREGISDDHLQNQPSDQGRFSTLPGWLSDEKQLKIWQKDFEDWLFRSAVLQIYANENLKVYAPPDISQEDFIAMCKQASGAAIEADIRKNDEALEKKLKAMTQKISRQQDEVDEQKEELNMRRVEELGTHGELLISLLSKRRRSISSSLTKRRMTEKAKLELEQEEKELQELEEEYQKIEASRKVEHEEIRARWEKLVEESSRIPLSPMKKNINVRFFGVTWLPFHLASDGNDALELPASSLIE